jgi:hypothetical protein
MGCREELRVRLADLGNKLVGFRDAFEDMQDFIDVQVRRSVWGRGASIA